MNFEKILIPYKLRLFYRKYKSVPFNLLDVGCGNKSPSITKYWFPQCNYYGVDKEIYNNDPIDLKCMEKFYQLDLESSDLSIIPDDFFQIILFSHVIEHLSNGLKIIEILTRKLSPCGNIYIEFPSLRSLSLPSARGSLHFCDDESHIRLYDIKEIVNTLLSNNVRIIKGGRKRDWRKIILSPLMVPTLQIYSLFRYRSLWARGLWDLLGFADYVYGEKKIASGYVRNY